MRSVTLALAPIFLILPVQVQAQPQASRYYIDGQELYSDCLKGDEDGQDTFLPFGKCMGFIQGVVDHLELNLEANEKPQCVPTKTTVRTLRDIVVMFLRDNPEHRNLPGSALVAIAVTQAFKCE